MPNQINLDNENKLSFASRLMERKLAAQDAGLESLNKKLATILGFQGVILTLGAGVIFNTNVDGKYLDVFIAGTLCMLISVIGVIKLLFTDEFIDPPYTKVLWSEENLKLSSQEYKNQMITDMVEAYEDNLEVLDIRGKSFNKTLVVFGIGLVLIVSSLLSFKLWSNNGGNQTEKAEQHNRQSYAKERPIWR